jgi:hypothetical protein
MARSSLVRAALLVSTLLGPACHGERDSSPQVDSNTNWLRACESDRACPDALTCVCGQCTRACAEEACPGDLVCAEPARWARAGTCDEPARPYCGASCTAASPCADASQSCVLGLCVPTGFVEPPLSSTSLVVSDELSGGATDAALADAPPASNTAPPGAEDNSLVGATVEPAPELDGDVPGFQATEVTDAGTEPVSPVVQWEPPGHALLSVCGGTGTYTACVRTRTPQDAGAQPQITIVPLHLRDDTRVFSDMDGTSVSLGGVGSWTRVPDKGLYLQLDDLNGELPITPGLYSGVPDSLGCFEGVGPSSADPTVFRLCGNYQ